MLRRVLIALLIVELFSVAGLVLENYWSNWQANQVGDTVTNQPEPSQPQSTEEPEVSVVKLLFGGDVMLGRTVESRLRAFGSSWPFEKITATTAKADLFVANLESPFRSDAAQTLSGSLILRGYPPGIAGLKKAGVDVVSLANNHITDMGLTGLNETESILKKAGITFAGAGESAAQAKQVLVEAVNGVKIGFVSCTYGVNFDSTGVYYNVCSATSVTAQVKAAEQKADLTVLLAHFGPEYAVLPSASQKSVARAAIDAGADLVIGHHPHVPQPYEKYKGKYIFFSLGNLVFDQQPGEWRDRSALVEITVESKKIKSFKLLPYRIFNYGQPQFLSGAEAEAVVERFTP